MMHFSLKSLLIILTILLAVECQKWSTYNRNSSSNGKQSSRSSAYHLENAKSTEPAPAKIQQKQLSRGGIGAWGYIAITLTLILSGLGIYYFVIFYPIVCKKERMYDVMEMTTV